MAELISYVHVYDEHGDVHVFGPGVTVPAWAKAKITNPKAWSAGGSDEVTGNGPEPEPEGTPEDSVGAPDDEVTSNADIPAKSGPKATVDAWLAYAGQHGVTVPEDATRKDIIAAIEAAGIPTE